ncbi:hypothetical protein [Sphingomonas sp.]|uniref:hypothetical protein n=1 Tax=Sphingomonas sp. TaxID=28214 RepID=UPI0035BC57C8
MNLRFIDWIWHVRGSLTLAPELSRDDAFDRLDPVFRQTGTSKERRDDTLVFHKRDQAAQDKMSVFDSGVLRLEQGVPGIVLHYHLISRALLFCFLAPLLFLGIAQLTVAVGNHQKAVADAAAKAGKAPKKKPEKAVFPLNPIDKALGAPAPEKSKKKKDDKPSPTPAYVLAALFATLYVVGRVLEDRLVRSLFRKRLARA